VLDCSLRLSPSSRPSSQFLPAVHLLLSYPSPARLSSSRSPPSSRPSYSSHPQSSPCPAIQPPPIAQLPSAIQLLPAIAVPRLLLLFPLDYACGDSERVGSNFVRGRLVGEAKLVREGRASASRRRGWCQQGGFRVLAIKAGSWLYH